MWEHFFAFDDLIQVSVYIKLTAIIIMLMLAGRTSLWQNKDGEPNVGSTQTESPRSQKRFESQSSRLNTSPHQKCAGQPEYTDKMPSLSLQSKDRASSHPTVWDVEKLWVGVYAKSIFHDKGDNSGKHKWDKRGRGNRICIGLLLMTACCR